MKLQNNKSVREVIDAQHSPERNTPFAMNVKTEFELEKKSSTPVEKDTSTTLPETDQAEGKVNSARIDSTTTSALSSQDNSHQHQREKQYRQGLKTLWRAIILFGGLLILWLIIDRLL